MYKLVMLNGAPGSGKSPAAADLVKRLKNDGVNAYSAGFNDVLRRIIADMFGTMILFSDAEYAKFKATVLPSGKSGRDAMIALAEAMKEVEPAIWARLFHERILKDYVHRDKPMPLIICDSFGFAIEFQYLRSRPEVDLFGVFVNCEHDNTQHGEQFANDSRYNLRHLCAVHAPSSFHAVDLAMKALHRRKWI